MPSDHEITRHHDPLPHDTWFARPSTPEHIDIIEPDPTWPARYGVIAERIRSALGATALEIEHVGSTSVPDLPAKPIIDIDLVVPDSTDESSYVPSLERIGFELRVREPSWHEHRCLASTDPRANVHVWSPGSPESVRMRMFRDWLRSHDDDRRRYAATKRLAAERTNAAGGTMMDYNLRKQALVREILDRMFDAHGMR